MLELSTLNPRRHHTPVVRAQALSHLRFVRPNVQDAERFFRDFGLETVHVDEQRLFLRARGPEPFCIAVEAGEQAGFLGLGLRVGSLEDLRALQERTGAQPEPLDAPGGGQMLRLVDPSGFRVEVVCDQAMAAPRHHRQALPINLGGSAPARIDAPQRPPSGPSEILRLGHVVLEVAAFQATCAWYTELFGLLPSDVQVLPDGSPVVVFLRVDRGAQPTDHHTLAIAQGIAPRYGHSAFETIDLDAVALGGRFLAERGWTRAWGVGRHVLGSQIFDYFRDGSGHLFEHYCDGDMFASDVPMGVHPASREAMAQWGPAMPKSFTRPQPSVALFKEVVTNVLTTPDLDLRKLLTIARIFG